MKAKNIVLLLIPINILLAFIYNSITSEIEFNKTAKLESLKMYKNSKT